MKANNSYYAARQAELESLERLSKKDFSTSLILGNDIIENELKIRIEPIVCQLRCLEKKIEDLELRFRKFEQKG